MATRLGLMLVVSAVLGVLVSGLAVPFVGVLGFVARDVAESVDELPQELRTEPLPQRTMIRDQAGNTIATIYDQNRVNVQLGHVSRVMVKALVAIEDYRFYEHGALDLKGTLRALLTNQASDDLVQGGSSITQQLVKLTLLNQANSDEEEVAATEESYARKFRELRYAIALEKNHSKDWILERYLNTAYFGDGAYGIQAAARHYFDVDARNLDLRQSAMLAGIVQSPNAFDPTNDAARSRERRNVVLNRMAELHAVSPKKARIAKHLSLGLNVQPKNNGCIDSSAQFFCNYVLAYLKRDPALGETPRDREVLLRAGGLTIDTSIDMRMQEAAQRSVTARVFPREDAIGALALVEPGTGEVKALAQSRQLGGDEDAGQTFLNYTVPKQYGDANGFQPGSTFKAFVLAAAINQGIPLSTTIESPARAFIDVDSYETCDGPYSGSGVWDVKNFDWLAHTANLYDGSRDSINTFFAKLEQMTGICEPWQLARAMGVNVSADYQVPSFTLGVADVSPLEMAEAYATFAARGAHCDPTPVSRITDSMGNVVKKYAPHCAQVLPEPVADAVNDVLGGVVAPGGFGEALDPGQQAAGKTGTTSDNVAVWFVGYTPNLAGAATVAGVSDAGRPESLDGKQIGGYQPSTTAGSTTAGPIWGDAFESLAPYLPDATFTTPSPVDIAGVLVPIPTIAAGTSVEAATAAIEGAGFVAAEGGLVDSSAPQGTVAYIAPAGGTELSSGATVTLYISDGSPRGPAQPDHGHRGADDGDRRGGASGQDGGDGRG